MRALGSIQLHPCLQKPSRRHTGRNPQETGFFIIQVQIPKLNLQNRSKSKTTRHSCVRGPPPVDAGGSMPPDQPVHGKSEQKQPSTITRSPSKCDMKSSQCAMTFVGFSHLPNAIRRVAVTECTEATAL
ncbi:hypothetical protein QQF64_032593 [Cirrhinus molitorella]|uniref:Uncharacterized protein n=1 Tax=Cirrhinus molitorella TaxID=172907 RepID=A0ABR3N0A4_9TELE